MMTRTVAISLAVVLGLAACGAGDDATDPTGVSTTRAGPSTTTTTATDGSLPRNTVPGRFDPAAQRIEDGQVILGEVPQEIIDLVTEDAATTADPEQLEVAVAQIVVWADGSLGCPEPGTFYTQALVDGYQVVLDSPTEVFDYRVGENGYFFRCERDPFTPGGGDAGEPTG